MKTTQNLPTRLKVLRKKNKYSQEYVAEQLNISRQAISHWENGKSYPDIDNLILLADVFHITVDELLDENVACVYEPKVEVPETVEIPEEVEIPEVVEIPEEVEVSAEEEVPREAEVTSEVKTPNVEKVPAIREEDSSLVEILVLSIVLVLSANMPLIGVPIAVFIIIWLSYTKRHYKLIYVLCIFCIIMGIHEGFSVYTHFYKFNGNSYFIPR